MADFHQQIEHWRTPADFAQHLAQHSPAVCFWVRRVVLHHTVRPLPKDWRGRASMEALRDYYAGLGWPGGPHLFVCVGAPDPEHDGIWQLTPLNERDAYHSNTCNRDGIAVEVVGYYDRAPWPPALEAMVLGTIAVFTHWQGGDPVIVGHRDCGSTKTCPGRAISLPRVRQQLAALECPS